MLDSILGKNTSDHEHAGVTMGEREEQRLSYISAADRDPMRAEGLRLLQFGSYGGITYGKTASVLLTLEGIIGEDTMAKAMRAYFMKYRFTHPGKEDFLKTIEEVSGKDCAGISPGRVRTQVMDYAVNNVDSFPVNWYEEKNEERQKKRQRRHGLPVLCGGARKGDFVMPVEIEIKFDNGEKSASNGTERTVGFDSATRRKPRSCRRNLIPTIPCRLTANDFQQQLVGGRKRQTRATNSRTTGAL